MLEKVLKLYYTAMAGDVRSPMPHLFGPPGAGKTYVVEQAAKLLGVKLHVINVSRLSPLELEGVQMPDKNHTQLNLLTAVYWSRLKAGDIILFDEFLRGFPEVYNGLLDIMTSRNVAGLQLPPVFFIAASNSVATYDAALEDRLLHVAVPDPRKHKAEAARLAKVLVEEIGLLPMLADSFEMSDLIYKVVCPTYDMMDSLRGGAVTSSSSSKKGASVRNLIGQAKLRHVECPQLIELINQNNRQAMAQSKYQYVVLHTATGYDPVYKKNALQLVNNNKLTPLQKLNLQLNLQLIGMEDERQEVLKDRTEGVDENEFFAE